MGLSAFIVLMGAIIDINEFSPWVVKSLQIKLSQSQIMLGLIALILVWFLAILDLGLNIVLPLLILPTTYIGIHMFPTQELYFLLAFTTCISLALSQDLMTRRSLAEQTD